MKSLNDLSDDYFAPTQQPNKKKDVIKTIVIIINIVLVIAVIALTFTLVISLKNYQQNIDDLVAVNNMLQLRLDGMESSLKGVYDDLDAQKELTRKAQGEAEKYKNLYLNGGENNTTNDSAFSTVTDLLAAIKKNVSHYNNKEITVLGTMVKDGDLVGIVNSTILFSANNRSEARYQLNNSGININIFDDLQYTVAETGDLVKITGKVVIENGKIYLNNCKCEIVTAHADR
jgi:hypothetical protein